MPRLPTRVLVIDDDPGFIRVIDSFLRLQGCEPSSASSCTQALALLARERFDLILVDIELPDGSGLDILDSVDLAGCSIAVVTGHPSVESAARACRGAAFDYVIKPIDTARLVDLLHRAAALQHDSQPTEAPAPGDPLDGERCGELLSQSPAMREVCRQLRRVAPTDAHVFLVGESGTGKELAARAVHELSGRKGPFVAINCGAVAPELLASQLFGHERGSFTGAVRQQLGSFEQAAGGTLFLDEISEMALSIQPHLLRVLEARTVTRVGGQGEVPVDARIVAATNRTPEQAVADGALREDLYYRLLDFPVHLPPLRARREDIDMLAEHFLERLNTRYRQRKRFTPEARLRLQSHLWPGNVRELRNVVQRGFILAEGDLVDVELAQAPLPGGGGESAGTLVFRVGTSLETVEKRMLLKTLAHFNHDKSKTAEALGVSLKTVYNKLTRYHAEDLDPEQP